MPWYNTPLTKALACAAPWDAVLTILRSDPEAAKAADPRTGMSLLDLLNGFFPPFPKDDYPTHAVAASHIVSASMSNTYQECITHLLQGDALTVHTFSVWWDEVWGEAEDADARAATKAACGEVDANGATLLFHAMQNGAPTEVILNLLSANPDAAKVAFTPKTYGPFAIVDDTDYTTYPLADALARTYNCFNPEYLNHFDDEVVLAIVEAWPHIPTATAMLRLAVERERSLRVIRGLLLALPPSCVFEKYDIGRLGEEHGVGRGYNFALSEILCGGRLDVVQYLTSYGFPCESGTELAQAKRDDYLELLNGQNPDPIEGDPANHARYVALVKWLREVDGWSPLQFAAASRNWQAAHLGLKRPCLARMIKSDRAIDALNAATSATPWPFVDSPALQPPICDATTTFIKRAIRRRPPLPWRGAAGSPHNVGSCASHRERRCSAVPARRNLVGVHFVRATQLVVIQQQNNDNGKRTTATPPRATGTIPPAFNAVTDIT